MKSSREIVIHTIRLQWEKSMNGKTWEDFQMMENQLIKNQVKD